MKRLSVGQKDENGIYTPPPKKEVEPTDISIDDLMKVGLQCIRGAMKAVSADIGTGAPARESIMNLKDLLSMLRDLKKDEKDFLNNLTDEELTALGSNLK